MPGRPQGVLPLTGGPFRQTERGGEPHAANNSRPARPANVADIFASDEGGLWEDAVATMLLCVFDALMHTARRISYLNRVIGTVPSESINDTHPRTSAPLTQTPESSAPLMVCRVPESKNAVVLPIT